MKGSEGVREWGRVGGAAVVGVVVVVMVGGVKRRCCVINFDELSRQSHSSVYFSFFFI